MATHYKLSDVLAVLKSSASEFSNNNSFRHAAALSYYTIFSLPPLLLIVKSHSLTARCVASRAWCVCVCV